MGIWRLFLRLWIGALLIGHGTQKLFGWFGGKGIDATAETFEQLGLRPGRVNAIAAGVAEAGGGTLLATGVETPLAASLVTATMFTAIERVHRRKGPWVTNGGYEYPGVIIALVLALVETGPGKLSLGRTARRGPDWAAAAFAGGALGAFLVERLAGRKGPARARLWVAAGEERSAAA